MWKSDEICNPFPHIFAGIIAWQKLLASVLNRNINAFWHTSFKKPIRKPDKKMNAKRADYGWGCECLSSFQNCVLTTTAACQSWPHVAGSGGVHCCSSNTSCSITEVLDLSPPHPSHDRVCMCGRTRSGHWACMCKCMCLRWYTRVWISPRGHEYVSHDMALD